MEGNINVEYRDRSGFNIKIGDCHSIEDFSEIVKNHLDDDIASDYGFSVWMEDALLCGGMDEFLIKENQETGNDLS